jgi:hypothetical protein
MIPVFVGHLAVRLVAAFGFGAAVAGLYRGTRSRADVTSSLPVTLLLLVMLVAMATLAIGDNTARAFSLVGLLSIIRYRTIIRDTQDTAYVICSVALGMALGQGSYMIASIALAVVAAAAFLMRPRRAVSEDSTLPYTLDVRLALGEDAAVVLGPTLDRYFERCRVATIATGRQGLSIDLSYRGSFRKDVDAAGLVPALNRVEGVQSVSLNRLDADEVS